MRVVAGSARGVRLDVPRGDRIRPTSDRAREATFAALGSMGLPAGAEVVDLFAGTGALGIEAASRGAARVTFVDRDPVALATVEANLRRTGLDEDAAVVRADVMRWLDRAPQPGAAVDLALVDPPYAFDRWTELLERLRAGVVVVESDRPIDLPDHYELHRERRYASTVVRVAVLQERSS